MSSSRSQSRSTFLSTFNWEESNLRDLLKPISFTILYDKNDSKQPFCHHTHKNLKWKQAPFLPQIFVIYLEKLTNIKNILIDNYTHGSEITLWIAQKQGGEFIEVYRDKYICKGKTLKKQSKLIDLGALPCQLIKISVTKGCKLSSQNLSLLGIDCQEIGNVLGTQYYKLLVMNPLKIIYPEY